MHYSKNLELLIFYNYINLFLNFILAKKNELIILEIIVKK